jgi:hypothetical protein
MDLQFFISGAEYQYLTLRKEPIPVIAQAKKWVCGRSLAGIVGSIPAGGMDVRLL